MELLVTVTESEPFPAHVYCAADGRYDLWNGWIAAPAFDRATAERIRLMLERDHAENPDNDYAEWDGDTFVLHSPVYESDYGEAPERIAPDSDGRYSIGSYSYCWEEYSAVCGACGKSLPHDAADAIYCAEAY